MNNQIMVLKDEEKQQPVPNIWRMTLCKIVESFKNGDFQLKNSIHFVRELSSEDALRIAQNIEHYGARLTSLPDDAWRTSVCQWMLGYWDVLIDLFTEEEGASDLVLFVRVYELAKGYEFQIESVHVP
jgi:hypothetical protein